MTLGNVLLQCLEGDWRVLTVLSVQERLLLSALSLQPHS